MKVKSVKQKTKLQIINETVKAYSNPKNRAVDRGGICVYSTNKKFNAPTARHCAVGRCINPAKFDPEMEGIISDSPEYLDFLLPEYQGHSVIFWASIQDLHDDPFNFNDKGFSKEGREAIKKLKIKWKSNNEN